MTSALSIMIENTNFVQVNFNFSNSSDAIGYIGNYTENITKVVNYTPSYMKRDPLIVVISMTVLYSLIFVSGLLGNIITCIVIAKNRAMHTATNYYLFSLAISDLLLLISGMPFEMYEIWFRFHPYPFGEAICILQGFAAETSANATVLTITAFTAERYIAICHPFLSHTMSKLSRAIKFILGIWLLAMGLAVPQVSNQLLLLEKGISGSNSAVVGGFLTHPAIPCWLVILSIIFFQILDLGIIDKFETCGPKNDERKYVFTISSIVCFVLPMVIITVFYILIGLQLRKSRIVGRSTTANGNSIRLKTKCRVPSKRHILVTLDADEKTNPLLLPVQTHSIMEAVYSENRHEIGQRINTRSCCEEGRKNYSQNRYMGSRHVVNMLVAVVVAFFVCWAPHHAQRIFAMNAEQKHADIYDIITPVSGVLYYISTCINPLLYNIMSYKFREAFKATCARCFYHHRGNGQIQTANGKLCRNISQRSNSHSAHTCSSICSGQIMQQVSACILEQDLSLLKCTKRPLTVTFKKTTRSCQKPGQEYSFGAMSSTYRPPSEIYTNNSLAYLGACKMYQNTIGPKVSCNWTNHLDNTTFHNTNKHLPGDLFTKHQTIRQDYSSDFNHSMEGLRRDRKLYESNCETPRSSDLSKQLEGRLHGIADDLKIRDDIEKHTQNKNFEKQRLLKSRSLINLRTKEDF